MKFNMEFFNNKRLLIILSGVASIMIALVIFVMSLIGFGNISAFMFGAKDMPTFTEGPSGTGSSTTPSSETPTISPTSPEHSDTYTDTPTQTAPETPTQDTQVPSDSTPPTNTTIESPSSPPTVSPDNKVTGIKINQSGPITLQKDGEVQLTVTVTPSNATNYRLEWTSGDDNAALVSTTGKVRAVSDVKKTVYITVKCFSQTTGEQLAIAQVQINVEPKKVSVDLVKVRSKTGNTTIYVGETLDLEVDISPASATNKSETWASSDTSIATVANRKVTAKAPGKVIITVTVDGKKDSLEITVLDNTTPPPTEPGE